MRTQTTLANASPQPLSTRLRLSITLRVWALDARRNEERIIIRIGRELSGHEYECSGLDGVAVRRDRLRCVGQKNIAPTIVIVDRLSKRAIIVSVVVRRHATRHLRHRDSRSKSV